MVKTKLIALGFALSIPLCCLAWEYDWQRVPMDGHMAGTTVPTVDNVNQALGTVKGCTYYAPNGKKYRASSKRAAKLMIAAQPSMASVKESLGYAPHDLLKARPQCELSNMIVDCIIAGTQQQLGQHIDAGLLNFGGLRVDWHQGEILLDHAISIMPFKNYVCVVTLKGSDFKALFQDIVAREIQVVGGVELTVSGKELVDIKVGGQSLDPQKEYRLATVDFLLNGGDGICAQNNAVSVEKTDILVRDILISYLKDLKAQGKNIEYKLDNRIIIL